jgi:glycosyltransferase involved in cell wall biosynthesis
VSRSIQSLVDAAPEHSHHLLASGADMKASWTRNFASRTLLTGGVLNRSMKLRKAVREGSHQVVHAHSSWAGVYARLLPLHAEVVYQPHCYATEMSVGPRRAVFAAAERILGLRRQTVVVLSRREERLAARYSPRARRRFVPNTPSIETVPLRHGVTREQRSATATRTVVTAGRLSAQKDPSFFAAVATRVRAVRPTVRFVWIGGGSSAWSEVLSEAEVDITGWVEPRTLSDYLDAGDLYLHSAAWEGFPLSVLDASARGLPVLVRAIPAFEGTLIQQVQTVEAAAAAVLKLLNSDSELESNAVATRDALSEMSPRLQKEAISSLYRELASAVTQLKG